MNVTNEQKTLTKGHLLTNIATFSFLLVQFEEKNLKQNWNFSWCHNEWVWKLTTPIFFFPFYSGKRTDSRAVMFGAIRTQQLVFGCRLQEEIQSTYRSCPLHETSQDTKHEIQTHSLPLCWRQQINVSMVDWYSNG